jgi:hypothetical protein
VAGKIEGVLARFSGHIFRIEIRQPDRQSGRHAGLHKTSLSGVPYPSYKLVSSGDGKSLSSGF